MKNLKFNLAGLGIAIGLTAGGGNLKVVHAEEVTETEEVLYEVTTENYTGVVEQNISTEQSTEQSTEKKEFDANQYIDEDSWSQALDADPNAGKEISSDTPTEAERKNITISETPSNNTPSTNTPSTNTPSTNTPSTNTPSNLKPHKPIEKPTKNEDKSKKEEKTVNTLKEQTIKILKQERIPKMSEDLVPYAVIGFGAPIVCGLTYYVMSEIKSANDSFGSKNKSKRKRISKK